MHQRSTKVKRGTTDVHQSKRNNGASPASAEGAAIQKRPLVYFLPLGWASFNDAR
jgi:hypothetical protein